VRVEGSIEWVGGGEWCRMGWCRIASMIQSARCAIFQVVCVAVTCYAQLLEVLFQIGPLCVASTAS
jgi:hypothetical protein